MLFEIIAAIAVANKKLIEEINSHYTPEQLGEVAEAKWEVCSFPQPYPGSFSLRATQIVGDKVLLKGVLMDSIDYLFYETSCLVDIKELRHEN